MESRAYGVCIVVFPGRAWNIAGVGRILNGRRSEQPAIGRRRAAFLSWFGSFRL